MKLALDRCPHCGTARPPNGVVCPLDGEVLVPAEGDPLLGTTIGGYRVLRRIGTGGMGAVYEVKEETIGKRAALKVLHAHHADNPRMATLLAEAQAVNAIGDEGIVDIYALGTLPDRRSYLLMELLEGELLEARLSRGALTVLETLELLIDILHTLEAAHAAGFAHRDLKPDNVFLAARPGRGMKPKLLDFGIAHRFTTASSEAVGTPGYASPEQAANANVGPKADLYALGCMTFEMLSRRAPFVASSIPELLQQHAQLPRPSVRSLVPEVPHELDAIVLRLMAIDPRERPASAAAVRLELLELRRRLDEPKPPALVDSVPPLPVPRQGGAGKVALGAALLLVVVLAAFALWPRPPEVKPLVPTPVTPIDAEVKRTAADIDGRLTASLDDGVTALLAAESAFPGREEWAAFRGRAAASLRAAVATALEQQDLDGARKQLELLQRLGPLAPDDALLATQHRVTFALGHGMVRVGDVFVDRFEHPNRAGAMPTTKVDWADAVKLCEEAGKHLCSEEEWERACRGADGHDLPWGEKAEKGRCADKGKAPAKTGAFSKCQGKAGVADLIGNVAEWTASLHVEGKPQRVIRGGSFKLSKGASCTSRDYRLPGIGGAVDLGLRCCL